jgi:hypothetical protein
MASITSANASFIIKIPRLVPGGVKLDGFATDNAWATEEVEMAEVQIGVDGLKSEGYVFALVPMEIHFAASSKAIKLFETWIAQQKQQKETFSASGMIVIPATSTVYECTNGTLTRGSIMPNAGRTLQPRQFQITWESITGGAQ